MLSLDVVGRSCRSVGSPPVLSVCRLFSVRLPFVSVSSFDVSFRLVLYVVVVLVVHTEPHVVYRSFWLFSFGDGVEIPMTHWSLRSLRSFT